MKIFIGADHRGFSLKEDIKSYLLSKSDEVIDMGTHELDLNDDYPDFAYPVAQEVMKDPANSRGILICGSAMGMDVVANKVRGMRATVAYSKFSAQHARQNDDILVITLAADVLKEREAQDIVDAFLTTPFSGEERHIRRLQKIAEIERQNFKE